MSKITYTIKSERIKLKYTDEQLEKVVNFCTVFDIDFFFLLGFICTKKILDPQEQWVYDILDSYLEAEKDFTAGTAIENRREAMGYMRSLDELLNEDNTWFSARLIADEIRAATLHDVLFRLKGSANIYLIVLLMKYEGKEYKIGSHFTIGKTEVENWEREYKFYKDNEENIGGNAPFIIYEKLLNRECKFLPDISSFYITY